MNCNTYSSSTTRFDKYKEHFLQTTAISVKFNENSQDNNNLKTEMQREIAIEMIKNINNKQLNKHERPEQDERKLATLDIKILLIS